MPKRTRLTDGLAAAFRAVPRLEAAALRLGDLWYQVALLPFRRRRIAGQATQDAALVGRTEALNLAADRYFHDADPNYLLNKPYSDRRNVSRHLLDVAVIIDALQFAQGDTIVELGAGSCWLSHMLNLCGCRTIAVDVSPTALAIGRRLFERDPRTDWSLEPKFEPYDGHRLPLATDSVDRVVVNDAFHHVPNQREILSEMCRVLKPDGLVVMSEPGHGHSSARSSTEEVARSGVLENELVLEDLVTLARSCGFAGGRVVIAGAGPQSQIEAADLGAFMGGKRFTAYWKRLCNALEQHHYVVLYKQAGSTTRHPGSLKARITIEGGRAVRRTNAGATGTVVVRVRNTGDTTWLSDAGRGWTRLGAHLYAGSGQSARLLDYDWLRLSLPHDVPPGQGVEITGNLPPIQDPGRYSVLFDMVVEGLTWFADRGSESAPIELLVEPPR